MVVKIMDFVVAEGRIKEINVLMMHASRPRIGLKISQYLMLLYFMAGTLTRMTFPLPGEY